MERYLDGIFGPASSDRVQVFFRKKSHFIIFDLEVPGLF